MRIGLIAENPLEWLALRSGRAPTPFVDTMHTFMEKEVGREYTREHDASREFPYEV